MNNPKNIPSTPARPGSKPSNRSRLLRGAALIALGSAGSIALLGCGRGDAKTNANAPRVVRIVEIDASRHGAEETTHYTGVVRARTESNWDFESEKNRRAAVNAATRSKRTNRC